jgi:superfamily II DNA/RNA helicase
MDEAHNLRSALELDHKLLKSFQFKEGDGFYELLAPQANTQKYSTKELNIETSSDILRKMCRTENSRDAKQLLKTLSQWRGYCVTFRDTCNLHFLLADPKKRNVLPKGRLFLFSATRLDQEELCFYCDIPKNLVKTLGEEKVGFTPKANVNYGYLPCDVDTNKMKLSISLLEKINQPSLILLNNKQNCETWASELGKVLVNRVITIESGLSHAQRLRAYRKFFEKENSILLTSSNVFWEGITIKELKILLIPNIPFPQPTMLELAEERSPEYRKIAERRLIQGIGRIGRVPQTKGVCILFFRPPKSFGYFAKISPSEICKFAEQISI